MKKMIVAVVTLVMMLTCASGAMAQDFSIYVPCEGIPDNQLYQYRYHKFESKARTDKKIYVSHHVDETGAVETNRIAAYREDSRKTMGANWHRADDGLYQCMSNAIVAGQKYTVAGRGNTNYVSKYGLNNITLNGYFKADR